ncbi:hypothetical protein GW17_00007139, partial [Ensete ventricosum]
HGREQRRKQRKKRSRAIDREKGMQRRRLRPSSVAVLRSVLTCAIGTVSLVALLAVHVSPSSSPFPAAYTLPKVSPLLLPLFASLGHSTFIWKRLLLDTLDFSACDDNTTNNCRDMRLGMEVAVLSSRGCKKSLLLNSPRRPPPSIRFDSGMTPTRRRRRNRRSCGSLHQTMVVSCLALNPPHRIHVT